MDSNEKLKDNLDRQKYPIHFGYSVQFLDYILENEEQEKDNHHMDQDAHTDVLQGSHHDQAHEINIVQKSLQCPLLADSHDPAKSPQMVFDFFSA